MITDKPVRARLAGLDLLQGVAALAVVAFHVSQIATNCVTMTTIGTTKKIPINTPPGASHYNFAEPKTRGAAKGNAPGHRGCRVYRRPRRASRRSIPLGS